MKFHFSVSVFCFDDCSSIVEHSDKSKMKTSVFFVFNTNFTPIFVCAFSLLLRYPLTDQKHSVASRFTFSVVVLCHFCQMLHTIYQPFPFQCHLCRHNSIHSILARLLPTHKKPYTFLGHAYAFNWSCAILLLFTKILNVLVSLTCDTCQLYSLSFS